MQTEQLVCWSGKTDTEHKTSGSNEEFVDHLFGQIKQFGSSRRNKTIKFDFYSICGEIA